MRRILQETPPEINHIVDEVVKLEMLHLHEGKPRLLDEIERIVIQTIKKS